MAKPCTQACPAAPTFTNVAMVARRIQPMASSMAADAMVMVASRVREAPHSTKSLPSIGRAVMAMETARKSWKLPKSGPVDPSGISLG